MTRADVLQFLEARGAAWREDSSNRDLRFSRNAIRHELLPQLSARWNPQLTDALAHLADITFEEELWWQSDASPLDAIRRHAWQAASNWMFAHWSRCPERCSGARSAGRSPQAKGDLRQVEFEHVERVIELASGSRVQAGLKLPGLDVRRSFDWLRLSAPELDARHRPAMAQASPNAIAMVWRIRKTSYIGQVTLQVPGAYPSPDGKSLIQLDIVDLKSSRKRVLT